MRRGRILFPYRRTMQASKCADPRNLNHAYAPQSATPLQGVCGARRSNFAKPESPSPLGAPWALVRLSLFEEAVRVKSHTGRPI